MATDIQAIARNLEEFYDFAGKTVLHVGAGGGQGILYARRARQVIAVDNDGAAVRALQARIAELGLRNVTVRQADFFDVGDTGDVVFFEFCLHEIARPEEALRRAFTLAAEVLVVDHVPESRWSWCCAETEKAARSWGAVDRYPRRKSRDCHALQLFPDLDALRDRIAVLGEPSLTRIRQLAGGKDIEIAMDYRLALIGDEAPA